MALEVLLTIDLLPWTDRLIITKDSLVAIRAAGQCYFINGLVNGSSIAIG